MSMQARSVIGVVLALTWLGGCEQTPGPGGAGSAPAANALAAHPAAAAVTPAQAAEDEGYTVLLLVLSDPSTHIQDGQYYQKALTEKLGWKGVFVIDKAGHSEVFWGKYRSPEQASANLRIAKDHRTQAGTKPFGQALIVPLPGADIGPAQWNLRFVKAPYTLLVATFQDDSASNYVGRRQFAINYCKQLRDAGYEAYFYHYPSVSLVTIGGFGAESVSGSGDSARIVNPKILSLQQDFPMLAINGNGENEISRSLEGKVVMTPKKTVLIRVPQAEGADQQPGQPSPAPSPSTGQPPITGPTFTPALPGGPASPNLAPKPASPAPARPQPMQNIP